MKPWVRSLASRLAETGFAVALGLLVAGVLMAVFGYDPIAAYAALWEGSVGSAYSITVTLSYATPLILTALTFAVGVRAGLFNIGAEGQLYVGAMAAVAAGALLSLPPPLHVLVVLAAAALGGILWSIPPALLKISRGVHEVISTIMLNWIAWWFCYYLVKEVLGDPHRAEKSLSVAETARIPLMVPETELSWGLAVSILLAVFAYLLLWRTVLGYEMRATGHNPEAAEYGGIDPRRALVSSFVLGGLFSGVAGALQVAGRPPTYAVYSGLSNIVNLGFDGIAVALLGANHPLGIIFAAVFMGGLAAGSHEMQAVAGISKEMVLAVQGVIIIAVSAPEFFRLVRKRLSARVV